MSLAERAWTRISIHKVVLEWLRADRNTNVAPLLAAFPEISQLLDKPDLCNRVENLERLRFLYMSGRWIFLVEIPPDTEWYEVEHLADGDLSQLYTVNYADWNHPTGTNELAKVADWKKLSLTSQPSSWEGVILWGHGKGGPFTIIDGNHRLSAYVASKRSGLKLRAVVGLSPLGCIWQRSDGCKSLMQELIRQHALNLANPARMVNTLKQAIAEVAALPEADQEQIGRNLLSHVEKLRRLREELNKDVRSLDAGKGSEFSIEEFIREKCT